MDSELSLFDILRNLDGEELYEIFVDHKIDLNGLKYINSHHLDNIIPKHLYGPRVIFENKLKKWQDSLTGGNNSEPSTDRYCSKEEFIEKVSIEEVLRESFIGKNILEFYERNSFLNTKHRMMLSNCLVEFLIKFKICPKREEFEIIADKILDHFKTENKDIYFIPAEKRGKPRGYLYMRYHNQLHKFRKEGFLSKRKHPEKIIARRQTLKTPNSGFHEIDDKKWLQINIEPMTEIISKWQNTHKIRKSFIDGEHSLEEIFDEWPLYKQSFGYRLIDADYSLVFPNNSRNIFDSWDNFSEIILEYLKEVKDPDCVEILKEFHETNHSEETKACVILYLIHSILKPSSRVCTYDPVTKKKKHSKSSIQDSRNSFMLIGATTLELNSKVKHLIDTLYLQKETLQPIICCVGKSVFSITHCFVYYGSVFYKLNGILTCVDIAFKTFNVLNIHYPRHCKTVWSFLQYHFYGIKLKNEEKTSVLTSFLADLKKLNKNIEEMC
ncbi:uncharacterized protein LOC142230560 isoform X2 [Haematobia irritans]|uniref:uncharacterized protein LOC142230560 isoform X2 n=1 Tax=Haematobia irritans TaxID=7368 RepID=UPI003F50B491